MNHIKNFNETLRTLRSSKRSALSDISNNELKKKDNIMKETKFEEVSKPDIVKPKRMRTSLEVSKENIIDSDLENQVGTRTRRSMTRASFPPTVVSLPEETISKSTSSNNNSKSVQEDSFTSDLSSSSPIKTRSSSKNNLKSNSSRESNKRQKTNTANDSSANAIGEESQNSSTATSSDSITSVSNLVVTKSQSTSQSSSSASSCSVANDSQIEEIPRRSYSIKIPICKSRDPALCIDSLDAMYDIYYHNEPKYSPSLYMVTQADINARMRGILIDWLVEVHNKFKLQPLTLWLCVNILDRYLSIDQVHRSKLQLVGVTSLLIACKYEEVFPPAVKDCVYITDYAYDGVEITKMESKILNALEYHIFVPTGYHFLIRYLNVIQACDRVRFLASYYAERNLQEYDTLKESPHHFAAAAVYAALCQAKTWSESRALRDQSVWTKRLQDETGFKENELKRCARSMIQHVNEEPETASKRRLVAAKKKYAVDKYLNVSSLPLPQISYI